MEFASHLDKKLLLPVLLEGMLYELHMQDPQKNDCLTCLKVRLSFGFLLHERVCHTFFRTQKKVTDKLTI